MNLRVVDELVGPACEQVAAALTDGGTLMLSGGSTPRPLHVALAGQALPWEAITVGFVDERAVPPGDPASNYGAAHEALLRHVPARVLRMRGELPAEQAAREYEAQLPERLDLVVLGMGADGHTCSLFPGEPALEERRRLVVATRAPVPPHARISLTLPALARAERVVFLVTGAEKARTLARVQAGEDLPAARVVGRHGPPLWLVDRAAASKLG